MIKIQKKNILKEDIIYEKKNEIYLKIIVKPNKKENSIKILDNLLFINIKAAPKDGQANLEIIHFLSSFFNIDINFVEIHKGFKMKNKIVKFDKNLYLTRDKVFELLC